jgi:uncharacterized membrane protein affecting hemolysin expression
MILHKFIKSWRGVVILLLVCLVVFMGLMIDSQVRSQMIVIGENNQLKADSLAISEWRKCMENTNLYTIENEKYTKLSEIQECNK